MKYISKVVEIEAEKITKVYVHDDTPIHKVILETNTGRVITIISCKQIEPGDYLNVTDPGDIYHMPARSIDGPNAYYEAIS